MDRTFVRHAGQQSGAGSHAIRVTGGKPTIYLEDAQISVASGNAIDIQGGNHTIHVKGNDNEVSSNITPLN